MEIYTCSYCWQTPVKEVVLYVNDGVSALTGQLVKAILAGNQCCAALVP